MNKNDLRYIKTEKLINDTYMALLREKKGKLSVTALCTAAMINKTTFYKHYESIEALHKNICETFVEKTVLNCPGIEKAHCDPEAGVHELVATLLSEEATLSLLFHGNLAYLINLIEDVLLKFYLQNVNSPEKEAAICFAIGGAARVLIHSQSEERIAMIIEFIKKVL